MPSSMASAAHTRGAVFSKKTVSMRWNLYMLDEMCMKLKTYQYKYIVT